VGLERGPLSLVSKIEELLERKYSGSGVETREYGRGDSLRWPRGTLYPQKLALTSLRSGGRSVGIVRSQTEATELVCVFIYFFAAPFLSLPHWQKAFARFVGIGYPLNPPTVDLAALKSFLAAVIKAYGSRLPCAKRTCFAEGASMYYSK
jgi:hypothetical protein